MLVLAACLLAAACGDSEIAPRRPLTTQAEDAERLPDQVIQNGTHTITREGVKKAVMEARRISFFNLEGKVEADTIEVTFYDENGRPESRLNALFGEIDQNTNDMLARGRMIIVSEDGTRIQGEELRYEAARNLLVSSKPVSISQHGNRIRGKSVESDPALTNIRLSGSSAVLKTEPREKRRRKEAPAAMPAAPPGAGAGAQDTAASAAAAGGAPADTGSPAAAAGGAPADTSSPAAAAGGPAGGTGSPAAPAAPAGAADTAAGRAGPDTTAGNGGT